MSRTTQSLSPDKIEFIRQHKDCRPIAPLIRQIGVGLSTWYRYARKFGYQRQEFSQPRQDVRQAVLENWADMSASEIAKLCNCHTSVVTKWRHRLNLGEHSEECQQRLKEKMSKSVYHRTAESFRRGGQLKAIRRRLDQYRIWEGRDRKTKERFAKMPLRAYKAKWHLMKHYNYTSDPDNHFKLYYSSTGKRSRFEHKYAEKYSLQFIQKQ